VSGLRERPPARAAVGRRAIAATLLVLGWATRAGANEVAIPVRLDLAFLHEALVEQIFREPGVRVRAFDDGVGCGWLDLFDPRLDAAEGRLRIASRGEARLGLPFFGLCLFPLRWQGQVEVFEAPRLEGSVLVFEVVDSHLYDEDRTERASRRLWNVVKDHVHPRLAGVRIDLGQPLEEVRQWLPLVLPGSEERIARLQASLRVSDPRVLADAIGVSFAFDVEPRAASREAPEPELSAAELARWRALWQRWDAFLTFVVKRSATDAGSAALERAVLDVLLDARHDLLEALTPSRPGDADPVPELFVRSWERLAPVLREEARDLPAQTALRYVAFVAAGDALAALHALGPGSGLEISADGLRRLARMLAPEATEDPLAYTAALDPELRTLLGFGPALPAPAIPSDVEIELESDSDPPGTVGLLRLLSNLLSSLFPAAWAAIPPRDLARLNRWAPTLADRDAYLPLVRDLLEEVAGETAGAGRVDADYRELHHDLVLATAWQESCWRHFVRRRGRLAPLESPVGAVGLMQVNPHVWRGVYDLQGLRGDIAYNARAGNEILLHYLEDHALEKEEHLRPGGIDNLARATYAAYNGGPRHLTRYRAADPKPSLARIDRLFWEKFVAVRTGREMEVARCFGGSHVP